MCIPRRLAKSTQPLPSIHTAFHATKPSDSDSTEQTGHCLTRYIEDGIEMVPLERSNILSAPMLTGSTESDKEVLMLQHETTPFDKPLPTLPKSLWARLSMRKRILAVIAVQIITLLIIGLATMAVKRSDRSTNSEMPILQGPYAVSFENWDLEDRYCVPKKNESLSWQCAQNMTIKIDILDPPKYSNIPMAKLTSFPSVNNTLYHGPQTPNIQTVVLNLLESKEPVLGGVEPDDKWPVHHFRTTYDRVVLLKEDDFKLAERIDIMSWEHPALKTGEAVWKCVFNATTIEGYLFANERTLTPGTLDSTPAAQQGLTTISRRFRLVEYYNSVGNAPSCEKMTVQNGALVRQNGTIERVTLSVVGFGVANAAMSKRVRSARLWKRQQDPSPEICRCQWTVT